MKGDNKTNKAIEFLYKLSMRNDFIRDVEEVKKLLKIPNKGFENIEARLKWIDEIDTLELMNEILFIREKYSVPLAYNSVLQEYIETGKVETQRKQEEFVAFRGDRGLSREGLKHWVDSLIKKSGVKFHLHRFRHTFGCKLSEADVNVFKIQKMMGHENVTMTMKYARSLKPEDMGEDIGKISFL